ncbi:EAL domain-containing protein [Saccharomonospora sp. NPDC006951]
MPNPDDDRAGEAEYPDHSRDETKLARKWAYFLSGIVVVSLDGEVFGDQLRTLLTELCAAIEKEPANTRAATSVGERIVDLGYVGEPGLRCTMDVLGKGLPELSRFQPADRFAQRITLALGELACGFVAASLRTMLAQQDHMQRTLLKAVRDAKGNLERSEARFHEIASSSSSGILSIGLDERIVDGNDAACAILEYSPAQLSRLRLADITHPDSLKELREDLEELMLGPRRRITKPHRLLRGEGDTASISLTVSVLRDADNRALTFDAVIEDGTELTLLRNELHRQALHDPLTGLPNRQYFTTHLEGLLRGADHGVTVFLLDIDGFGLVRTGLGGTAAERILTHVAGRLENVFAGERTMVARLEADEFAVVIENAATPPDPGAALAQVRGELAEPLFVGDHGVAVSVSAGVAGTRAPSAGPDVVLRDAGLALRRAKSRGRGQWAVADRDRDTPVKEKHALAAGLPGAWENGQLSVLYQPSVRLTDFRTVAVEVRLSWAHPRLGVIGHDRCAEFAERTGFILPLGEAVWRIAMRQVVWWQQSDEKELALTIGLTTHQALDSGLVASMRRLIAESELAARLLTVGFPAGSLQLHDAVANLTALAGAGIRTGIDSGDLGPADIAAAQDLPVRSLRVGKPFVERVTGDDSTGVRALVPLAQKAGASVAVDGVSTARQATWWRDAGADTATGDLFGAPCAPGDISGRLRS